MRNDTEKFFIIIVLVLLFGAFGAFIYGATKFSDKVRLCEAKGGIMADTPDGHKCFKVEEIKL